MTFYNVAFFEFCERSLDDDASGIRPQSTIDSYNRRNFVRKAAFAFAAAGIGVTFLGKKKLLLGSEAKSDCRSPVLTCTFNSASNLAVWQGSNVLSDVACSFYACAVHGANLDGTLKTVKCCVPLSATLTITNTTSVLTRFGISDQIN